MAKFKDKERILKASREKQLVIYKGALIKLSTDFSIETLQARLYWHKLFFAFPMESKDLQPRLLYPAMLSFKMDGEIRTFPTKIKRLKDYISTNLAFKRC